METFDVLSIHFSLDSVNDGSFGLIELLFIKMFVALMPAVTNVILGPLDKGLGNVSKPGNSLQERTPGREPSKACTAKLAV